MSETKIIFGTYDQAGLDAQYNNRARVPDHERSFQRWRDDSAAARKRLAGRLGIAYGPGERDRLDLFPAGAADAPTLLFFHGGYWQAFDRSDFSYLAPPWVEAGVSVAVASYPLAPAADMDQIVAASRQAVIWLGQHARDWHGRPDRIFSAGHSAGGHIVGMLMTTDWRDAAASPFSPIAGGISISGLFELEPIRLCYLNAVLRLDQAQARRNSPLARGSDAKGRLILAVGGAESPEFLRQNRVMAEFWRARGLEASELTLAGRNHFSAADALAEPGGELFRRAHSLISGVDCGM